MNDESRHEIAQALVRWYDRNKRQMPWRDIDDPYRIVLSEFMLQQTQVDTVIPYFEQFTKEFPTVHDLANADLDRVLKLWEGLGYYTRARNLHKAARTIADDHSGKVPQDYHTLKSLPGFGPYTTAAVLSMAYGKPHAVLDGNVIRVLSRLLGMREHVNLPAVKRKLQGAADDLLNVDRPGDHNQAMMDLGATVCRPRKPRCRDCPISKHCEANTRGLTDSIPAKTKRKSRPERIYLAVIVRRESRSLISRRKPEGLLGGLWEFPTVDVDSIPKEDAIPETFKQETGLKISSHRPFGTVKHGFTHFSAVVHAFVCEWESGDPHQETYDRHEWVTQGDLDKYAYSRIARQLVDSLVEAASSPQTFFDFEKHKEQNP